MTRALSPRESSGGSQITPTRLMGRPRSSAAFRLLQRGTNAEGPGAILPTRERAGLGRRRALA